MSEHPRLTIALHWRSKRRALNLAYALRGRSTGWGDGKPRRWFIGHHRHWYYHRGLSLTVNSDPARRGMGTERTLLNIRTGASPETRR